MKNGKIIFVIIGVAVVASVVVVVWRKSVREQLILTNPPVENTPVFTPPVYGSDGGERFITLPLELDGVINNAGLSEEQKKRISDFKKRVLARVTSATPLKEFEKNIIAASISTTAKPTADGLVVASRDLFQFTENELRLIFAALQK